ncbi:hypothetical protein QQS21_007759 [Conoideocrella luteorostrata]|uniref:Uncharacterized protein n=1 Tax=Conoideocrella luteorostrata TaxID=1105319 RepID=A0AAJ0FZ82_9HYPO|nr:hypothetical protein QQS21_007759 [Conoideocrella luteorostrata]
MSGLKDKVKNRLPEKSTTGLSIRGKASGLMGRNKDSSSDSSGYVARPLSDLKDPASFAPPPKRTGSGLAPPPPPVSEKRQVITSPSKYMDPRADHAELLPRYAGVQAIKAAPAMSRSQNAEAQTSKPYRVDTTRLSTQNLPEPPARRDGADGRSPPPYNEATRTAPNPKGLPPNLPPRLPPRNASNSPIEDEKSVSAGDARNGMLNDGAVNRLGAAGVFVPGLSIGRIGAASTSSSSLPPHAQPSTGSGSKFGAQVNELQGRFSKMGTPSTASSAPEPPSEGTTWAQKQAALRTASGFHKDPSSVSLSDAKTAASTANNFRQRHRDQITSGVTTASNMNQKYGVMDKVSALTSSQGSQSPSSPPPLPGRGRPHLGATSDTKPAVSDASGKKKPPPLPPKRKPGLAANPLAPGGDVPPPIPMSTRPAF